MTGLEKHTIRRYFKSASEQPFQGPNDGCSHVRAASHRLDKNNVWGCEGAGALNRRRQIVEVAAKTGARDFSDVKSQRAERLGIDELAGVIVRDNRDPLPAIDVGAC